MPFFTKYQPVRLEDSDDLESNAVPPQYSTVHPEATPLGADGKIVFVIDEKKLKRRRRCVSFLKFILISWALIALFHHFGTYHSDEGERHGRHGHHRHHGHHMSHKGKSISSMVDHYLSTGEVKIESTCKREDGGKEVFYYAPEDGVKSIDSGVLILNVTLNDLIADGKINGGRRDSTDPTLKVSLTFETDISPEVFEHLVYSIDYDEYGQLVIKASPEESYEVKGCLIAHLDIHEGDVEDDDDGDDDEPEEEIKTTQRLFGFVGVQGDIGSFELINIASAGILADLRTGAVVIEDSASDRIEASVTTGLIHFSKVLSMDIKTDISGAGLISVKSTDSPTLTAAVNTGSISIASSSIDNFDGKVGAGKITIEDAATSDHTVIDAAVGTGAVKVTADGDHFYGKFDVRSKLGGAKVLDLDTVVPIEIDEPEKKWEAHRKVTGIKGTEGEGTGDIKISVGLGSASLEFVKLGEDEE